MLAQQADDLQAFLKQGEAAITERLQRQILVIGDAQIGKSQLISLLTKRGFNQFLQHGVSLDLNTKIDKTLGCDIRICIRQYNGKKCKLKFWDLSGDKTQRNYLDIYLSLMTMHAIIFCFDCTNLKTLDNFRKWIKSLMTKRILGQDEEQKSLDQNSYSRQSSSNIQEEQDNSNQYQSYSGMSPEMLMNIPVLFVGCKKDLIPQEKEQSILKKCSKKIGSLVQNQNNANLFLVSSKQIGECREEFRRLEVQLQRILSKQDLGSLFLKTNPIAMLELRLDESFWKLRIKDPLIKRFHLIKIYLKHCLLSLLCKKNKK